MHENTRISFTVRQGHTSHKASFEPGDSFLAALFRAGFFLKRSLCAGLGRCGRCRIRFVDLIPPVSALEHKILGPLADQGYRLACLHKAASGFVVEIDEHIQQLRDVVTLEQLAETVPDGACVGLAVDLGTTSLAYAAVLDGRILWQGEVPNPQLGAGREVLSRLSFAQHGGAARLRQVVLDELLAILGSLPVPVSGLCLAANPSMTALALGLPVDGLAASPYSLPTKGDEVVELGPGLPACYVPPQLSPFVGGDAVAAYVHLAQTLAPKAPWLVADLGTNGEFILDLPDGRALAASIPMGPALEGVGVAGGVPAQPGAVSSYGLGPKGLVPKRIAEADGSPSKARPGPCGAGFVSLCAHLLRHKILGPSGLPTDQAAERAKRLGLGFTIDEDGFAVHIEDVRVSAADVEELLSLKAAFDLALSSLLEQASLAPGNLGGLYLAGALGRYLSLTDLETLGFLPAGLSSRCKAVGNAALFGAAALLGNADARACAVDLASRCLAVDLTATATESGSGAFVGRMCFEFVGPTRSTI